MGCSTQNARAIACGITTRIQRSHHAADGSHVGGLGYGNAERRGPRAENTTLPAAANRRNRLGQGKGNRERLDGGAKSQNRGSTASPPPPAGAAPAVAPARTTPPPFRPTRRRACRSSSRK